MSEIAYNEAQSTALSTEPANVVPQQLAEQREAIDYLGQTIDRLQERLAPILGPDTPHAVSEEKRVNLSVPLADELALNTDRLRDMRIRLDSLAQRLGI